MEILVLVSNNPEHRKRNTLKRNLLPLDKSFFAGAFFFCFGCWDVFEQTIMKRGPRLLLELNGMTVSAGIR